MSGCNRCPHNQVMIGQGAARSGTVDLDVERCIPDCEEGGC